MSDQQRGIESNKSGQELCDEIVKQRIAALRTRATVLARDSILELQADTDYSLAVPEDLIRLNAANKGYLLGLGDSWFDYLMIDVTDSLDNDFGYDKTSVAEHGRSLRSIRETPDQLKRLSKYIERSVGGAAPKAILLSGGGNDLVDFGIQNLLNDFGSGPPRLIESAVKQLIDEEIKSALIAVLDGIKGLCQHWLKKTIPILIHGYDYPIPDGSYLDLGLSKRGPWLHPCFLDRGYDKHDLGPRTEVMKCLINRLNEMQLKIVAQPGYEHVKHVELRGTLTAADYKTMWGNELHPTSDGFIEVARKFDRMLKTL